MAKRMNFLKTSSSDIANRLIREGYTCVGANGEVFTFVNSKKMTFTEEENKHIVYSNKIEF